jgi:spore coat-associated protein N
MSAVASRLRGGSAKKLALSGVLLAAGAALAGHGAFATFTSSATGGPQTVSTGTVTIVLGSTGSSANRLNINATGVAPGDTIQRSVNLSNSGSLNLAAITLGLSASPTSTLDTDAADGLQTTVQSCSVAWTEAGPPYVYTCSGTTTSVLASTAVATLKATPAALPGIGSLTASGSDHLLVTLSLPSVTGNSFRNLSSTLTYTFTGTQRAAQSD